MSKISEPAPTNLYIYCYQHTQINKYNNMNRIYLTIYQNQYIELHK